MMEFLDATCLNQEPCSAIVGTRPDDDQTTDSTCLIRCEEPSHALVGGVPMCKKHSDVYRDKGHS